MERKETTEFLSKLLISALSKENSHYAREVTLDYGTKNIKRIDFMKFEPKGVVFQSDIEKGIFTCYEVKSCKEDIYSGNGLNFIGEKNYIVTTMECYKKIIPDIQSGKLQEHILKSNPQAAVNFGVMVPVPWSFDVIDEFEKPTNLTNDIAWELKVAIPCRQCGRRRSTTELLFCMLRSGR